MRLPVRPCVLTLPFAAIRRSHSESEARRLLAASQPYFGLAKEELAQLKRNDPRKLATERLTRQRTSVSNRWLAQIVALGHASIIRYHGKRHPREMAETEVTSFLTHLAREGNMAASTQNQALSALLFDSFAPGLVGLSACPSDSRLPSPLGSL
jgi:hypothetical protein